MTNKVLTYDAVLIPGGGIRGNHELPPWVQVRFDRGLEIHHEGYFIALSGGTTHKPPPLDREGYPVYESRVGAEYLIKQGVDPRRILCETVSLDTIGNAYFSRVIHVEPRGFKRLLVITSASHMPRTKAIFQWVYGMKSPGGGNDFIMQFEEVPDLGMEEGLLRLRLEKEKKGLENLMRLQEKLCSFEDFHRWLYTEHGAYSVSVEPQRLKGEILKAY